MARGNVATRVRPETTELVLLTVLRRERLSEHFMRITLGGPDLDHFQPMGADQWFRLFLPAAPQAGDALRRLPNKLTALSYARLLTISKAQRPVMRSYTARAFRAGPDGAELDVDFVLHGGAGVEGPASTWAASARSGDRAAVLDEGILFTPPTPGAITEPDPGPVVLVGDESALPAIAAILGGLDPATRGTAVIEVPSAGDRQPLVAPPGLAIHWMVRTDPHQRPGQLALQAATELPAPAGGYGWVAGEQQLATELYRHWVRAGMPKAALRFCGYWRQGRTG